MNNSNATKFATTPTSIGNRKTVNILNVFQHNDTNAITEETMRNLSIGKTETFVVLFSQTAEEVHIHYFADSFYMCNGEKCVLCDAGVSKDSRLSLPVYCPEDSCISLLQIPTTMSPHSLWPLLTRYLNDNEMSDVLSITREGAKYQVRRMSPTPDLDRAKEIIKKFTDEYDTGKIDLSCGYKILTNEELIEIPTLRNRLKIKGLLQDDRP